MKKLKETQITIGFNEQSTHEDIIDKMVFEVSKNRAKILDDFAKAYLAGRWEDYFSKQNKIDFRRLELVEDRSESPEKITYHFRLKKGKLRSN